MPSTDTAAAFAAHLAQADAALLAQREQLHREAAMCRGYVAQSACAGIGGAGTATYRKRKNRQLADHHAARLSEMRQRAEAAEARLGKLPLPYAHCFPIYGNCFHLCPNA